MIYKLVGIVAVWLLIAFNKADAAPVWATKPIQCATVEEVLALVSGYGEVPYIFFEGATSRPGETQPLQSKWLITRNKEADTWTLIEIPHEEQACILGAGKGEIRIDKTGITT